MKMVSRGTNSASNKDFSLGHQSSNTLHMQQQCEINLGDNDQQDVHADMQRLQSPIFNIHIHVPPYQGENLKMYLPRIQPVIHLHFDELARNLAVNREQQNEESNYRALEKLLSMTTPRFGNVRFHYQDKPKETVRKSNEFEGRAPDYSVDYSNDTQVHREGYLEKFRNRMSGNCGMPDCCGIEDSVQDTSDTLENNVGESDSNSEETLKRKFNLKEAIVLVEDICKTDYYKNMVAARRLREATQSNDDFLRTPGDTIGQDSMPGGSQEYRNCCIKTESDSCPYPEPVSPPRARNVGDNVIINPLNSLNQLQHHVSSFTKAEGPTQSGTDSDETKTSEQTLDALAEGCNFSDILSRFQVQNYDEYDKDSMKCFVETTKLDLSGVFNSDEKCNYESKEGTSEHSPYGGPITGRVGLEERDNIYRNSSGLYKSGCSSRNLHYSGDCKESVTNRNANWNPCVYKEVDSEDTALNDEEELDLDDMVWTSEEATTNSRVEIVTTISPTRHESFVMSPLKGTRDERFVSLGRSGFQLDVFKEEMGRGKSGRTGGNLKKKAADNDSSPSKESSPPKKIRLSVDESKKSRAPSEGNKDYIVLQASGPTKFAVAPLNKVNPYKTHDARNFKKDMLFGNRINRFTNPDHLRIYQMKQKAAKTQSN